MMERSDEPAAGPLPAPAPPGQGRISVALLAAVACVPIVIAVGFLVDRTGAGGPVPGDISVLALRGGFDAAADRRPSLPMRAGY